MKRILIILITVAASISVSAQEKLSQYMKDANESITKKDYRAAQTALQKALTEINITIGNEILSALPLEINGMKADAQDDTNGGSVPGIISAGVTVTRDYMNENRSLSVTVISNSPAAISISMMVSNPSLLEQSEGGQKVVEVGKFFGLLSYEAEDKSGDLQIPVGNSIVSINADELGSADEMIEIAKKLNIENLKKILGD